MSVPLKQLDPMPTVSTALSDAPCSVVVDERYGPLMRLAHAGLRKTINPLSSVYDRQLRNARIEPTRQSEDLTSTCICLIGIDRSHTDPRCVSLAPHRTLNAAIELAARRQYQGATGLLIWANSVIGGTDTEELATRARLPLSCERAYFASFTTMELAWLASGLLHDLYRAGDFRVTTIARAAVDALHERYQSGSGLMPHAAVDAPYWHRLRRRIANFADQIYAVQAFAFAAIALGDKRALERAVKLAERLVSLQGPRGQWWWHYDSESGVVAETYPVYSVHQYGMAPMALMAVEAAGGPSFRGAIQNSHAWLCANELGADMIDFEAETIWRDIRYSNGHVTSLARKAGTLMRVHRNRGQAHRSGLKVNYETRPYEWAWCLYAAAIESRFERKRHLV